MPAEYLGFDLSGLASMSGPVGASRQTHQSALSDQNVRDQRELVRESTTVMRGLTEEIKKLSPENQRAQQEQWLSNAIKEATRENIAQIFQQQGMTTGASRRYAGVLSEKFAEGQIGEQDLDKSIKTVSDSFRQLDKNMFDFMKGLMSYGAGGGVAEGFIRGQPMAVAGGLLGLGSSLSDAVNRVKLREELKPESEKKSVLIESIKESIPEILKFVAGAALTTLGEAFRVAPERIHQAYGFQQVFEQARIGGLGMSPEQILQQGGMVGGQRILNPQEQQQFLQQFARTGGGGDEEFKRSMDLFTRNTIVFGESAQQMLQVSRSLRMWVPDKSFDQTIQKFYESERKAGIAPELIDQQMQAMAPILSRIMQLNAINPDETMGRVVSSQNNLATRLGLRGQMGVQAAQGLNEFAKASVSDPSKFQFLMSSGLAPEEIYSIFSGEQDIQSIALNDPRRFQQISQNVKRTIGDFGGRGRQGAELTSIFGQDTAQMFLRDWYGYKARETTAKLPTPEEVLKMRGPLGDTESKFRDLQTQQFISGFAPEMQTMAKIVVGLEKIGEEMITGISSIVDKLAKVGYKLDEKTGELTKTKDDKNKEPVKVKPVNPWTSKQSSGQST